MSQKRKNKAAARSLREAQQGKKVIILLASALLILCVLTIALFSIYL